MMLTIVSGFRSGGETFCQVIPASGVTALGFHWRARASSEIGTDALPSIAVIGCLHHVLRAKVKRARVLRRENQRRHLRRVVLVAANEDVHNLSSGLVEAHHAAVPPARVNNIRVQGIGRDVAELEPTNRKPIAKTDLAVIAAAGYGGGAAILLWRVGNIRELIVGDDVIELPRRLVVPRTPRLPSVDANRCALIDS